MPGFGANLVDGYAFNAGEFFAQLAFAAGATHARDFEGSRLGRDFESGRFDRGRDGLGFYFGRIVR